MSDEEKNKILDKIRKLDPSLSRIKINSIQINKKAKEIEFILLCDNVVSQDLKDAILIEINEYIPDSFKKVVISVSKIVADGELVARQILNFLGENYPSISHRIIEKDIAIEMNEGIVKYNISIDEFTYNYFFNNNILFAIDKFLNRCFCDRFFGEMTKLADSLDTEEYLKASRVTAEMPEEIEYRVIPCENVKTLDKKLKLISDIPRYIVDIDNAFDSAVICGNIESINESSTKNGKIMFKMELNDKTGVMEVATFPSQNIIEKIRELKVGDAIICEGRTQFFRSDLSMTARRINTCSFPKDFVPKEKKPKKVACEYKLIFPENIISERQANIFDTAGNKIPQCIYDNVFVVFDLETTGLSVGVDKITEIGAVKIINGEIKEKFQTLLNPGMMISDEITALTGIDNSMVEKAPKFEEVIADFFKFCDGAILVAHNIDFDYKFLSYSAKECNYVFKNDKMDTMALSRELLHLVNNKLNTIAEYFHVEFMHHRALSDAFATAQIFIELIKIKKCLPNV